VSKLYALNLFNVADKGAGARAWRARSGDYIWHLFDRLDDLRSLLK
jgi:hypothetical protein